MNRQGFIRVGTSGIVVPGTKPTYPDEFKTGSRLHYYASLFNTLEINSSFYKIPLAKTFAKWATEVPDDFTFTVKCWRGITHTRHLDFAEKDINTFMLATKELGAKAGCLLIQFPASINIQHIKKIEAILAQITQQDINHQWQLAIELRHISLYCDAAYKIFEKYRTAIAVHDMPGSATPLDIPMTDLLYRRFHGPTGNYDGSYSDELIHLYAGQINHWQQSVSNAYIYFNNTIGAAFANGKLLQRLLRCQDT